MKMIDVFRHLIMQNKKVNTQPICVDKIFFDNLFKYSYYPKIRPIFASMKQHCVNQALPK